MNIKKITHGLLEFAGASLLVVLIASLLNGLSRLPHAKKAVEAEVKGRMKGIIQLTPYKAEKSGPQYIELPRTQEEKRSNYTSFYGRKLLKERETRYISQWDSKDTTLKWSVEIAVAGEYRCHVFYRLAKGCQVKARLEYGDQSADLLLKYKNAKWPKNNQALLKIEKPGLYDFTLKIDDIKGAFDFHKIELKPVKKVQIKQQTVKK